MLIDLTGKRALVTGSTVGISYATAAELYGSGAAVLINGRTPERVHLEIPDGEWERLFAVNGTSGIRLSRSYLPEMQERGWGRVVFVSSESALNIPPEMVHYGVTKLARLGVTKLARLAIARGWAEAVAGSGVTVNSVLPGPTLTDTLEAFMDELIGDDGDGVEEAGRIFITRFRPTSPIGRVTTSEEVASLIVYPRSTQAAAATGTSVQVDGGVVRTVA